MIDQFGQARSPSPGVWGLNMVPRSIRQYSTCVFVLLVTIVAGSVFLWADPQQRGRADPMSALLADSEGVGEFSKSLEGNDLVPNAVSKEDFAGARGIYPEYVAFLAEMFRRPPKDERELLVRIEALAGIYDHFMAYGNVSGWVYADTAKLFAIAEERHWIACRLGDHDIPERLSEVNKRFRIDPLMFIVLAEGVDIHEKAHDDGQGVRRITEWSRGKYMEEIAEASDQIWQSHGYDSFSGVYPGRISGMLPSPYPDLLSRDEEAKLAYGLLLNDSRMVTGVAGTIEFLERGGDIRKVDLRDARYLRSILPWKDAKEFGYPAIGIRSFTSGSVIRPADVECKSKGSEREPSGEVGRAIPPTLKYFAEGDIGPLVNRAKQKAGSSIDNGETEEPDPQD